MKSTPPTAQGDCLREEILRFRRLGAREKLLLLEELQRLFEMAASPKAKRAKK